jgi:hypothetical protein
VATVPVFRTWVAGEIVTAAFMNTNIRDAGNFFVAVPVAVLRQTVAQSFPNSTFTALLLDTEDIDRDGGHSTVTNTSRYTGQTPGWYTVQGSINWAASTAGQRTIVFRPNGGAATTYKNKVQIPMTTTVGSGSIVTVATFFMNGTTDYVEVVGWQNSGGALNTYITDEGNPSMNVHWVST